MSNGRQMMQQAATRDTGDVEQLARDLDDDRARLDLTLWLIERGHGVPDELECALERLCARFPGLPRLSGLLGHVRAGLMKFEAAAEAFEAELELAPDDGTIRLALGRALARSYGRFEEAEAAFEDALAAARGDGDMLCEVARFQFQESRFARAVELAARGRELDLSESSRCLLSLIEGQALCALRRDDAAEAAFEGARRAADLLIDHGDTHIKLVGIALKARALQGAGRGDEVTALYQTLVELLPVSAEALRSRPLSSRHPPPSRTFAPARRWARHRRAAAGPLAQRAGSGTGTAAPARRPLSHGEQGSSRSSSVC